MNEQGPWIPPGPRPDPEYRRGGGADRSGPESRGGDGFRGGPNRRLGRRLLAGVAVILLALLCAAVALFVWRHVRGR